MFGDPGRIRTCDLLLRRQCTVADRTRHSPTFIFHQALELLVFQLGNPDIIRQRPTAQATIRRLLLALTFVERMTWRKPPD